MTSPTKFSHVTRIKLYMWTYDHCFVTLACLG